MLTLLAARCCWSNGFGKPKVIELVSCQVLTLRYFWCVRGPLSLLLCAYLMRAWARARCLWANLVHRDVLFTNMLSL
jgi:hypothetical protein